MVRASCRLLSILLLPSVASATTYQVGAARTQKSPCALAQAVALMPGDVIEVDAGTYTDQCQLTASGTAAQPIVMRGVAGPRPVFDATGKDLSGAGPVPRAIFQWNGGSYWVVEHLELENAANTSGANGSGFRVTAGGHDITLRDLSIHDCQDGAQSDGASTITIESSEIFHNGAGDGQSHNLYLQGESVRLIGNHIHDSVVGQNIKLRTRYIEILYNLVENSGNYEMDLIQGPTTSMPNANAILIGNVVVRAVDAGVNGNNGQTIVFSSDDPNAVGRNGSLYAINNTFILRNASNKLFHVISPVAGVSHVYLFNNIVHATVAGTSLTFDTATADLVSGSNNFISTAVGGVPATVTTTIGGADPGFAATGDYRLAAASPAIDAALANPMFVDGAGMMQSGVPTLHVAAPLGTSPRPVDARLDVGAFEFGSGTLPGDGGVEVGDMAGGGG
ncbi:MAG: putative peptidoglycan bound protein, partial [Myxococcales bacterium]|nr:putative peptidoglycan bound protein [Myxococcales bacterium]